METNYFGAVRCAKAVIPQMRQSRSGLIVNITSVAGRVSTSPFGPYAASKFALEALSEALAQEMKAFGVRVAIVEPGIIDTPMAREIELPIPVSLYPQQRRMAAYFAAALQTSRPPLLVAEKIRQIIETGPERVGSGSSAIRWGLARRHCSLRARPQAMKSTWACKPPTTIPGTRSWKRALGWCCG